MVYKFDSASSYGLREEVFLRTLIFRLKYIYFVGSFTAPLLVT